MGRNRRIDYRLFGILALLACAAVPAFAAGDCGSVFTDFVQTEDVQRAISGYEKCAREESTPNPILFYNLGVLYEAAQNWDLAAQNFQRFLDTHRASGTYADSARAEIDKLKTIQGTPPAEYSSQRDLNVAEQMLRLGLSAEAELLAKRAASEKSDFRAYTYAAIAEYQQHELDSALTDVSKAIEIAPRSQQNVLNTLKSEIQTDRNVAQLCIAARAALKTNPKASGDLYNAAWQLKPERTDIGFAAVLAYFGSSEPQSATEILQKLSQAKDAAASARAAHMRMELDDLVGRALQKRRQADARFAELLKNTKKDWSDLGSKDLQKLESELQEILRLDFKNEAVRHRLAFVFSREQKWSDAESEYRRILSIDPQAKVNFWLARVLFTEKKYDESQLFLLRSIQNPGTESAELREYLSEDLQDKLKKNR